MTSFGHAAGDELLRQIAKRIRRVIREVDTLARLGGDEFAVLQAHTDEPEAMTPGRRAGSSRRWRQPFRIDRQEIRAGVSIGIASCPQDGATIDALLRQADLALYRAKEQGRGRFCFFEPGLDAAMARRRQLAADLAGPAAGRAASGLPATARPGTGRVVGVEALLRWRRLVHGMVAPSGSSRRRVHRPYPPAG